MLTLPRLRRLHFGRSLPLWSRFVRARELKRQRIALTRLDDHLLKDVGLTPHEALREAERPYWDAPNHWRK